MSIRVQNVNNVEVELPKSAKELVSFVRKVAKSPESFFLTWGGYPEDVLKTVSEKLKTHFFGSKELNGVLLPFTTIYVNQHGEVQSHQIGMKSKITLYAK